MKPLSLLFVLSIVLSSFASVCAGDTVPALAGGKAPANFAEMWAGFDPRDEPLEIQTLLEWEQDDVVMRVVRFRIGVFKGKKATLAAVYGYPKNAVETGKKVPGLVQIHGGGQYADYRACLTNARRGYATVSIAWAGRISAPNYRVSPAEVKLFWADKTDDPAYRLTTDWGAVDGYHAPGRNPKNAFPSAMPAAWTLDSVESPRNSGWFLCALAARRALTFLEQQSEVDAERLGVYGHSMGGKLTVMASVDPRVKVAAPSCGGISDRDNSSQLFRQTLGDDVSLKQISCPIIFLSPANDFHGRIGDLPSAINEIASEQWRVTCSPHHSHQDSPQYEVATQLWFDHYLKGSFSFPNTPTTNLKLDNADGVPRFTVSPDRSMPIESVDIFYTQAGLANETPQDRDVTKNRHWHHADSTESDGRWTAPLPLTRIDKQLWVYANVSYKLPQTVTGAGYYYGTYNADNVNVSSLLSIATPEQLKASKATREPSKLIENFEGDWQKEWFTYKPDQWARSTHKLFDDAWTAPANASLMLDVMTESTNEIVVVIDQYAVAKKVSGGDHWQTITLTPSDLRNFAGESLPDWSQAKELTLTQTTRLKPPQGGDKKPRVIGKDWIGDPPKFQNLRWESR